jgi:hypothetical protein
MPILSPREMLKVRFLNKTREPKDLFIDWQLKSGADIRFLEMSYAKHRVLRYVEHVTVEELKQATGLF